MHGNYLLAVLTGLVTGISVALCSLYSPTAAPDSDDALVITSQSVTVRRIALEDDGDESARAAAEVLVREKLARLEQGQKYLETIPAYTATFQKREVVHGELGIEQTILLKFRRAPFSVYMHWLTGYEGREILYVEGANQGRLLAHDGGWKSRLPAVSLSPDSTVAMRDARYPVTCAGLTGLIELMLETHERELATGSLTACTVEKNVSFNGRLCDIYTTINRNADVSPVYRKGVTWIDQEWNVPLKTLHYEWPADHRDGDSAAWDETTLVEAYEFTEIDFHAPLRDADFTRSHPDYRFR